MWNTFGMIWVIYGIKILEIYFPTSVCAIVDSKPIKCLLAGATDPVRTSSLFRPNIEILDSWNAPMSLFICIFIWFLVLFLVPGSLTLVSTLGPSDGIFHYANTPMCYAAIFHGCKNDDFQMKNCDSFLIFLKT